VKKAFNDAVSLMRDGMNHSPVIAHSHLAAAGVGAVAYAYTGSPVAALITGAMLFFTGMTYHYEGREYREKNQAPKP